MTEPEARDLVSAQACRHAQLESIRDVDHLALTDPARFDEMLAGYHRLLGDDGAMSAADCDPRGRRIELVAASRIVPVETTYVLAPYIPRGEATWIEGTTKTGKTIVALDLIARLTRGGLLPPTGARIDRGRAAILTCEDSPERTIIPRLIAANADLDSVRVVRCTEDNQERIPSFARDAEAIERELCDASIDLLLVDGTFGVLGVADGASYVEAYARMLPLVAMIRTLGIGALIVRHVRKGDAPALHRGIGSVGYSSLARSTVSVALDPDDESHSRRLWAHAGCNVGEIGPTLTFSIEGRVVGSFSHPVGAVVWGEIIEGLTADQVMRERPPDDQSAIESASDLLCDLLADGPHPSLEIYETAKRAGVSHATLRRAAAKLGVRRLRDGERGPWFMALHEGVRAHRERTCSVERPEHLRSGVSRYGMSTQRQRATKVSETCGEGAHTSAEDSADALTGYADARGLTSPKRWKVDPAQVELGL